MFRCFVAAALLALPAASETPVGPSDFHIVSARYVDFSLLHYRVIDVQPQGSGSLIRYSFVGPVTAACQQTIIQSIEASVPNKTPAQIAGATNPCAVNQRSVRKAIREFARPGQYDTGFGVAARCGGSKVVLSLPISETIDRTKMRTARPDIERLWSLADEIVEGAFGSKDPFLGMSNEADVAVQRRGQDVAPKLAGGEYDNALSAAVANKSTFRSVLQGYSGIFTQADARWARLGRLLDAGAYRFDKYVDPVYPALAHQARISGKVELQLTVDQASGEVRTATVILGHRLLYPSAVSAAKEWRFQAASASSDVKVTIEYVHRCPTFVSHFVSH